MPPVVFYHCSLHTPNLLYTGYAQLSGMFMYVVCYLRRILVAPP